jgi:hypothetical protein
VSAEHVTILGHRRLLLPPQVGQSLERRGTVQHETGDRPFRAFRHPQGDAGSLRHPERRDALDSQVTEQGQCVLHVGVEPGPSGGGAEAASIDTDHAKAFLEQRYERIPQGQVQQPAVQEQQGRAGTLVAIAQACIVVLEVPVIVLVGVHSVTA